ncbi:MAG: ATP-binding cassette domain-containing protein [Spirochaetaceae bacterium]|nr:ATP-binding cassette domain-containing protein [Spirochaetaceae bacterium]
MIKIQDLLFQYNENPPLFENFCWKVEEGESWSILGASGAGKTTLLHLLASLKKPQKGMIEIQGEPLTRPRPATGLILQNHGLLPWATVEKNIELGFRIRRFYGPDGKHSPADYKTDRKTEKLQTALWMEKMGIDALGKRYPHEISGGQQQRTAIARTLILQPDLLLMDEPFSSLDSPTRNSLQKLVINLNREESFSRILVTHSIEEALIMGNRILILRGNGKEPVIMENSSVSQKAKELALKIQVILGEDFDQKKK